jgi:aerobic-type carbon monoxide dehydrogenase small subunit (CoxS/CutS family)
MSNAIEVGLRVNDTQVRREVESHVSLADFLRHELNLTGTHLACEHGSCGACTVLVNGKAVRSCLLLAVQASGCEVETVEKLAADGELNALQKAFSEACALQCGFCTAGILMSLTELERDSRPPDEAQIRDVLAGHLCRCTGYQPIVEAAVKALVRGKSGDE